MNKKTSDEKKNRPSYFDRIRKECEDLAPDEPRILENPSLVNFFKLFAEFDFHKLAL